MDESPIAERFSLIAWILDERMHRIVAAAEAKVLGHGGISEVAAGLQEFPVVPSTLVRKSLMPGRNPTAKLVGVSVGQVEDARKPLAKTLLLQPILSRL